MSNKLNMNEWTATSRDGIPRAFPPRSVSMVLAQLAADGLRKAWAVHVRNIHLFGGPPLSL